VKGSLICFRTISQVSWLFGFLLQIDSSGGKEKTNTKKKQNRAVKPNTNLPFIHFSKMNKGNSKIS
jgi:hypothetical protein